MADPQITDPRADDGSSWFGMEVYDQIMATIEPDLVSSAIEGLAEKYKEETDEQSDARAERYNTAYEIFNKALRERKTEWDQQMHDLKRKAFASLEKDDHEREMKEGVAELDQRLASM